MSENTQNFVGSMEVPERHRFDTAALEPVWQQVQPTLKGLDAE